MPQLAIEMRGAAEARVANDPPGRESNKIDVGVARRPVQKLIMPIDQKLKDGPNVVGLSFMSRSLSSGAKYNFRFSTLVQQFLLPQHPRRQAVDAGLVFLVPIVFHAIAALFVSPVAQHIALAFILIEGDGIAAAGLHQVNLHLVVLT